MWDRGILKSNAKIALRGHYWVAFAVALVAMLLGRGYSIFNFQYNFINYHFDVPAILAASRNPGKPANPGSLLWLLFAIFVVNVITIGLSRFFVQNHFGVSRFETLFSGFRRDYLNGVGAMFVTNLFIGLWYILFIIPGIVKTLQYSMVPYILSDNPTMPGSRAREISRIMTNGEKGAIFVLGLSFLGWYLLGAICFGVGILFVNPYYEATMAELYIFLRDRAIQTNQINPAELGLIAPAAPVNM